MIRDIIQLSQLQPVLETEHKLLSDPPDPETINPVNHDLRYEAWVRAYLENVGEDYGIEICGDLDEEYNCERGDYRGWYQGEEVVIEVEKDLQAFSKHSHRTQGEKGWDDVGKIDIVFTAYGEQHKAEEIPVPVIIANEDAPDGTPSFDEWYGKAKARDFVFNDAPKEYIHVLTNYVTQLLMTDWPSTTELRREISENEIDGEDDVFERARNNHAFAADLLLDHVSTFFPHPDDRDEIISIAQEYDSYWGLVDRVFNAVIHHAVEQAQTPHECDCGSDLFEICRGNRTHTIPEVDHGPLTEGQLNMQFAGLENNSLTGGVLKDQMIVGCCLDCEEVKILRRR